MTITKTDLKKRMADPPVQAGGPPIWVKGLQKQIQQIQQTITSQARTESGQLQFLDRIHDRLDAIAVETRVTNMLLSELVALHQTIITEDTDETREKIRNDAYYRVRNAE